MEFVCLTTVLLFFLSQKQFAASAVGIQLYSIRSRFSSDHFYFVLHTCRKRSDTKVGSHNKRLHLSFPTGIIQIELN